jgi:segregation and condensation protein A
MGEAYTVKLEMFEGPLDLLLHLIKKHEIDLYNIEVARITDQYLEYLARARDLNLDIAGEFLVMAATLIYLKSRLLLPPEERAELEEEEAIDPQAELVRQLIEHERFQKVGELLALRPVLGRDVFQRPVVEQAPGEFVPPARPLTVADLVDALERLALRRSTTLAHEVGSERWTLRDGLEMVLDYLRVARRASFDELFPEDASRGRIIVTFLALLELIRVGSIVATQGHSHGVIDITLVREIDAESVLEIHAAEAGGGAEA